VFNTRPYPFKNVITPRSEAIRATIEAEAAEALEAAKIFEVKD